MDSIYKALDGLKDIRPDFISVTFGAGGSQVSQSGGGSIRKIKTDKADAKKLPNTGLIIGQNCGNVHLWRQSESR